MNMQISTSVLLNIHAVQLLAAITRRAATAVAVCLDTLETASSATVSLIIVIIIVQRVQYEQTNNTVHRK